MRLFIGVWLSAAMRRELEDFLAAMSRDFPQYKWTSPKNLHFTLKFLGEFFPERIPELKKALSECAAGFKSFELNLGHTGYFPDGNNPNIVWIGVNKGRAELAHLAKNVEDACGRLGFPKESRPFQPHLTIARIRSGDRIRAEARIHSEARVHSGARIRSGIRVFSGNIVDGCPRSDMIFQSMTEVGSFSLIESQLTPSGSVYSSLADYSFGGRESGAV